MAQFLNVPLVEHAEALAHVQQRLARANLVCNAGNRQQALFPIDAKLLPNPNGTALGCLLVMNNKRFILLPGPPRECMPMFNDYVLPALQQTQHQNKHLLKWRLFGVAEGAIAQILDDALAGVDCETGYRCETPYLEFKVRCKEEQVAAVKKMIQPLIEPHIIATVEQKASERLRLRLDELQGPIVIIDDVTGGVLQTLLQRPSNYGQLMFHSNKPRDVGGLYFHLKGLDEYWMQKDESITHVSIDYGSGCDTHQLPYRNRLVVEYAAEWLCFRLFHLIDKLHQRVT